MHLDLDAFFAAVEQRDKPSLRGKPVIVGGVGPRGVVSTASYEARPFGVHSAMPSHEARRRCPHAAFLAGRFEAYRTASRAVMRVLHDLSPLVEPLSLDEAFVDLAAMDGGEPAEDDLPDMVAELKARIAAATGGLTASAGVGSSKFIAKLATELDKPDGLRVVPPGTEVSLISPMNVRTIPGVGPATTQRLHRMGIHTIAELQTTPLNELVREIGASHGGSLQELAFARDDRPVEPEREAKSISVEDTFDSDLTDHEELASVVGADAGQVAGRLRHARLLARTITIKVRLHGFVTHTRSRTLSQPTDRAELIHQIGLALLEEVDVRPGVRLLGVGVAGLTDEPQPDLFSSDAAEDADAVLSPQTPPMAQDLGTSAAGGEPEVAREDDPSIEDQTGSVAESAAPSDDGGSERAPAAGVDAEAAGLHRSRSRMGWPPGADVEHAEHGAGWVWGSGRGLVTVRFETATGPPGPVRTFSVDDPALHRI